MHRAAKLVSLVLLIIGFGGVVGASPARLTPLASGGTVSATTQGGTTVTMGSYTGADYGAAKELVYFSDASFSFYKVSELDWPLEPSFYVGGRFSARTVFGLTALVDLQSGIPTDVGYITDSDYLNGDGARTHFSQHTARLEHSLAVRADVGWRAELTKGLTVTSFARYLYRDIKWSARDGYLQYPPETTYPYTPWSASTAKYFLYGLVGLYQQILSIPAFGVDATYHVNDELAIGGSVAYSPFAAIKDIDNHVLRGLIFYDSMNLATYIEPRLSVAFQPSPSWGLGMDLSYFSVVSPKNGVIQTEDTTTGTVTSSAGSGSTAGATLQTLSFSIGLHVAL